MATLPDVRSYGPSPQPQGGVAVARPQNVLAGVGEAISAGGRNIDEATNIVAMANERQDALSAQSAANKLHEASILLQFDPKTGFRNIQGEAVTKDTYQRDYTDRLKTSVSGIRAELSNDNQKRIFDQHAEVTSLQYQSSLLQHKADQTRIFNDQTRDATIMNKIDEVARNPLELAMAELANVDRDSPLGPTVRDVHNRRLPGHQRGQRTDFVQVDVGMIPQPPLHRPAGIVVLHPIAQKRADLAVVHFHGDLH